jgi:hypothetical protein
MERKIDAWVDKKMVISIALGILLAGWLAWFGAFTLRSLGVGGYGMGYGGMGGSMRGGDMRGMHDRMQRMMDDGMMQNGAAGTMMEGTEVPAGIDPSAM